MKKRILPTRKRKALRRIARFLVILLVVNHFFGVGILTPRHVVWKLQQRESVTGLMRTVDRVWVPEVHATHLRYLVQNEKATMMAGTYLTVYGWMDAFATALDCTTGEPFYAAMDSLYRDGGERVYCFFGRVDDPAIERIDISLCEQNYEDGESFYTELHRFSIPREDWLEQSGRQYFLLRKSPLEWPPETGIHAFAVALDAGGRELYRMEITQGGSSYFG